MASTRLSTNTSLGKDETASQLPIRPGAVAGILLSVMSSPCTTISPSPWLLGRFRDSSSVYGLYPAKRYRRISLSEARALALQALFQAEAERIEAADWEAKTAYEWYEV
jgi:hypothetical protein